MEERYKEISRHDLKSVKLEDIHTGGPQRKIK
jgi:hypothetical protein